MVVVSLTTLSSCSTGTTHLTRSNRHPTPTPPSSTSFSLRTHERLLGIAPINAKSRCSSVHLARAQGGGFAGSFFEDDGDYDYDLDEDEFEDEEGSDFGFGPSAAEAAAAAAFLEEREEPPCPPGCRRYETMIVLRPDITEEQRLAFIQRYEELLVAGGGMYVEVFNRGVVPLSYSMQKINKDGTKDTYFEGIYLLFMYFTKPESIEVLETQLRRDFSVIRHSTFKIEKKKKDKKERDLATIPN